MWNEDKSFVNKKRINLFKSISGSIYLLILLILLFDLCNCERVREHKRVRNNKNHGAQKFARLHEAIRLGGSGNTSGKTQRDSDTRQNGLWPSIFNIATYARISANATCGTTINGREEFCRLAVELNRNRKSANACGVCDAPSSPDITKQHPIEYAIVNDSTKWWQSPTLEQGAEYEFVTITLDLRQIFQIMYVIVKAANSPRPGTWVLERSMDGENYQPWQYYAISDQECLDRFGIEATPGKPRFKSATDVICTSYYSKLLPLENGEIHTSLVNGRFDTNDSTTPFEHLEFTLARFVRLRFLQLRASVSESPQQKWFTSGTYSEGPRARLLSPSGISEAQRGKRLYYSIRDISIGGQCVCNGHASQCIRNNVTQLFECVCEHNTCGLHCEYCCPLFNQIPYKTGFKTQPDADNLEPFQCEQCECNGHAQECQYDSRIASDKESLDITGRYRGGGICINCTKFTTGVNCQQCIPGYYRPADRNPNHPEPCIPCDCHPEGSSGDCLREAFLEDENVGDCMCKPGYTGPRCSECANGYRGFPNCELCPCDPRGTVPGDDCEGDCTCKLNVEGNACSRCRDGYFALQAQNPEGCIPCYCSGVSNTCESNIPVPQVYDTLDDWLITDLSISTTVKPTVDTDTNYLLIGNYELPTIEAYYWLAPSQYLGNKLETYGSYLQFSINWVVMRGDTSGKPTNGPDIILVGANGLKIAYGDKSYSESNNVTISVRLVESGEDWYHIPNEINDIITHRTRRTEYRGAYVTRTQFLSVLTDIKYLLVRAKFHTDQIEVALERVVLNITDNNDGNLVEKCACPTGYTGLSCETCDYGYVKMALHNNISIQTLQCIKCDCNGHSRSCDLNTGQCFCEHNTIGEKCDRCAVGYYGSYPLYGSPNDCKRCACPLELPSNNFSPSCQLDILELVDDENLTEREENYVCTQCPHGYTGDHCEICDDGYFGNPLEIGSKCEPCDCGGGPCDHVTGQCLRCRGNTEGVKCEKCKPGHYGDAKMGTCKPCQCDLVGSVSEQCDMVTGACDCLPRFTGLTCSECEPGFGNVTAGCQPCECDEIGAVSQDCDPISGICECRMGVEGFHCDACQHLYYGFSTNGCEIRLKRSITTPKARSQHKPRHHPLRHRNRNINKQAHVNRLRNLNNQKSNQKLKNSYYTYLPKCWPIYMGIPRECSPCWTDCIINRPKTTHRPPSVTSPAAVRNPYRNNFKDKARTWIGLKYGCGCNLLGSELATCDIVTGKCRCKPHVIGRTCDQCEPGFWGINSNNGCESCNCDSIGSINDTCDQETGQCYCKPGVGGAKCDNCLDQYYEFSEKGCKECEYCEKPGHVCDPDTGRCVCPPFSHGTECNKCTPNSWGFQPLRGCKPCHCDHVGSLRSQCDPFMGRCSCREGYTGDKCNKCASGYYGFPRCRRCNCNIQGTSEHACDRNTGLCSCNDQGFCHCKSNVEGKKCDTCKDGTFGLEKSNTEGCTQCYCFGRTSRCTQAGLTWGQIRLPQSRVLKIEKVLPSRRPVNNIAYVSHTVYKKPKYPSPYYYQTYENNLETNTLHIEYLNETKGLQIIPGLDGNITIGAYEPFQSPLYWKLPDSFYGDHVVSYGGYLQFNTLTENNNNYRQFFPQTILNSYPLILIKGNGITLAHYPLLRGKYEVRFHESLWNIFNGIDGSEINRIKETKVSRNLMMIVLQNVQEILIRATDIELYTKAVLVDVTMDTAILVSGQPPPIAKGVELCDCPQKYNASSCQNPSIGFYRYYNNYTNVDGQIIIEAVGEDITKIIGDVIPCNCNGRSNTCDIETGYCTNCKENTAGRQCETCVEGYYGSPDHVDGCLPCPCPSASHNFARSCQQDAVSGIFRCVCKEGYKGHRCEQCSLGYYRNPITGGCDSCNCDIYGRASEECDQVTGQCNCKPGFNGTDCSKCEAYRHVLDNQQCRPVDDCTAQLLNIVDEMNYDLDTNTEVIKDGKIPAPYPKLEDLNMRTTKYINELYQIKSNIENVIKFPKEPFNNVIDQLKIYDTRLNKIVRESHNASNKAGRIRKKTEKLFNHLRHINQSITESVNVLNYFINSDKHINIKKAVRSGKSILEYINNIDFNDELNDVTLVLYDCNVLLKKLLKITGDLSEYYERFNDMKRIIDYTIDKIAETERLNQHNKDNVKQLKSITDRIYEEQTKFENTVPDRTNLDQLNDLSLDIDQTLKDLKFNIDELSGLKEQLVLDLDEDLNITAIRTRLNEAVNYSKFLTNLADSYEDKFKSTKDKALRSVEASQVYKNIKNNITAAQEKIKEALDQIRYVNETLYPQFEISLHDNALNTLSRSNRIKQKTEQQKNAVENLYKQQLRLNFTLDSVKDALWTTGLKDNNISKTLAEFNSSVTNSMKRVLQDATQASADMKDLYNQAKQIQDDKAYKLLPALNDLNATEANISVTVSSYEEKLAEAQTRRDTLDARLESLQIMAKHQRDIINHWNDSLIDKLQNLKNKIDQARRLASEVRIPLTSQDEQKCTRVYRPFSVPMGNSTSTTISFVFSRVSDVENSPIIYIGNTNKHFISIDMINKTIRLAWKLGDDTGIVIHPEIIEKLTKNSGYYYRVQVERIRNIGTLSVNKRYLSNGTTVSSQEWKPSETKTTNPRYTIFNFGSVTDVWVGGTPSKAQKIHPILLKEQGLMVSIYDLIVNENPIGLWNYHETQKGACKSDTYWTYSLNEYQFNGAGYAVREMKNQFASIRMSITLTFKTFDEDALLIAVVSPKNNSFLSISLEEGYLIYYVQYVGESQLKIRTDEKYNTGKLVKIEGSREFNRKKQENAILRVNGKLYRNKTDIPVKKKEDLPDLKTARYYLGGLSPTLVRNMKYMVSTFKPYDSFLGCMFDIEVDQVLIDPVDTEHDGVDYSCSERTLNRVGFLGHGYVKLGLKATKKFDSFSFIFNTQNENALLALLTLVNEQQPKEISYILVRMKSGQIECEIKLGKSTSILLSNQNYNDGFAHVFSLSRGPKHMELRMDDVLKDQLGQKVHGLGDIVYFGGFPDKYLGNTAINEQSFEGTILDVTINEELILFNSPLSFEHVRIGRNGPSYTPALTMEIPSNTPPLSMSSLDDGACNKNVNYSIEPGALKFGDGPYSHVQHPLKIADFWQKNFRLEFDFRTFYPNGMLFVSPGLQKGKQRHHILLQIKNSTVHLSIKGRKKREFQLPIKVNDGKWHSVQIQSTDNRWTLTVDEKTSHSQKRPKKLNVANKIYIGAWPEYGNRLPVNLVQDLETFKGCVRRLKVNGFPRDLTSNKTNDVLHNTGECFPHIESGSYFNGDAFAIYRKNFQLSTSLEFSLEFKTTELNGILLTTAGSNNPPMFSLELNNGRVILSAQVNYEKPIHVEVALPSPYDICDNKWHKIRGFYSENEPIIVKIDDVESMPSYATLGEVNNQIRVNFENALYIGGLPDILPSGTLQTRDNFHGCIKNIAIGNEKRDWTDMEELNNILLSSCPV